MDNLRGRWPALAMAAAVVAAGGLAFLAAEAGNPLRQAWSAAQAHARYTLRGTTGAEVGQIRAAHTVRGEGTASGHLSLALDDRAPEDSVTDDLLGPGMILEIAWPTVAATNALGAAIAAPDAYALALVLPVGDPLALLPTAHAPRVGDVEPVGERQCRRVDFLVSGLAYGAWWQRHRQFMPAGAGSGPLEKLSGEGVVWIEEGTRLPCRISLRVALVRLAGEQAGVGEADWVFEEWEER